MGNACLTPAQFAALWQQTPLSERAAAQGCFYNLCELRDVDKAGGRYVFKIGGNKYRLVAAIAWSVRVLWLKAVLTHAEYDKEGWK